MKNKIKFKRYLIFVTLTAIAFLGLFLLINAYQYRVYMRNYNKRIDSIVGKVVEKYPNITNEEIIEIINSDDSNVQNFAYEKYGINIENESIIEDNNKNSYNFLLINMVFLVVMLITLLAIFLKYEKEKDKEIRNITKYIEEINRKNYSLHIDETSEDELSILKNEIYKTTIMLKESAENSSNDKKQLKKSLEDISHQLKTPLTSILVMLEDIIDDPEMKADTRGEFIRDIRREVINVNFLVQSLLKLSKFDSNTITYRKEERLLKELVQEAVKNVAVVCDLKNINIKIDGEDNAKVKCDFRWQVEAITNIIKNCVEHSKENSKIIVKYGQNNIYSSITIKDFGDGIDERDLPHIFERFYKGKNASQDSVGIGLALAKSIVENDNGSIEVDSDESGSRFVVKYF